MTDELVRAFFALPLPSALRREVLKAQATLERLAPELRWQGESQLHLTLKFLGSVASSDMARLTRELDRLASGYAPIPTRVTGLDAFPSPRRARVLVLRLADGTGALAELAEALDALAAEVGVERETRPFNAHVTLARARPVEDVSALTRAFAFPPLEACFERAVLYQSTLQRSGSTYGVLHEASLGAPGVTE